MLDYGITMSFLGAVRRKLINISNDFLFHPCGLELSRRHPVRRDYSEIDITPEEHRVISLVRKDTMISQSALISLLRSVRHVIAHDVPGSLVECGVWRGGSVLAMIHTLLQLGTTNRDIFLYDTFNGIPESGAFDITHDGETADNFLQRLKRERGFDFAVDLRDVHQKLMDSGYPPSRIHIIQGDVRQTLPNDAQSPVALLRLDCDWYESTKHCLQTLMPFLSHRGVLIVDDYGFWKGCARAVDEYFSLQSYSVYLHRDDFTCRTIMRICSEEERS